MADTVRSTDERSIGEIRDLIIRINDAWLHHSGDELAAILQPCFHPDVVISGPDFATRAGGRDACISSYVDFVRMATILSCDLAEPSVAVWGDTATAGCGWTLEYEIAGERRRDSGHDIFVLARADGRWLAVARLVHPATD